MEKIKQNENQEIYEKLRQEIAEVQEFELNNKKNGFKYNPHFDGIKPEELTNEDLEIFKRFKEGTLTRGEFTKYQSSFWENSGNQRGIFMAWVANKLSSKEWAERWKKEDSYEKLRQELEKIKKEELAKPEEEIDEHWKRIELDKLTARDLDIYAKYKDMSLTKKEIREYRSEFGEADEKDPRAAFAAWLGTNMNTREWMKKFAMEVDDDEED